MWATGSPDISEISRASFSDQALLMQLSSGPNLGAGPPLSQEVRCVGYGERAEPQGAKAPGPVPSKAPTISCPNPFVVPHVEQPERCV